MLLLDTSVAIHLRDQDEESWHRLTDSGERPAFSLVTLIELEGGTVGGTPVARGRRVAVARLLQQVTIIALDRAVVTAYSDLLQHTGFSRPRILDRLIAATALVYDLTLATMNGPDFRDIPGLRVEVWPTPAQ